MDLQQVIPCFAYHLTQHERASQRVSSFCHPPTTKARATRLLIASPEKLQNGIELPAFTSNMTQVNSQPTCVVAPYALQACQVRLLG